ncbi:uncharacterized protein LOC111697545 [Eurytemora carolleeae]|uniref:uncharacterized protein LOC111697545 n=1 Tax=Eurytemora carolleeae TaxID=1294199 RepID=UPI000C7769CB|nr:uncharacterized protein LOC111697545 [Eurytemora carolleeae]|eukprot:XP_023323384.1 uncharacterized protein LOC111697545 [Eurytemora affinis]
MGEPDTDKDVLDSCSDSDWEIEDQQRLSGILKTPRKRGRALPYHTTPAKLAKIDETITISPMDHEKNRIKDVWKNRLKNDFKKDLWKPSMPCKTDIYEWMKKNEWDESQENWKRIKNFFSGILKNVREIRTAKLELESRNKKQDRSVFINLAVGKNIAYRVGFSILRVFKLLYLLSVSYLREG